MRLRSGCLLAALGLSLISRNTAFGETTKTRGMILDVFRDTVHLTNGNTLACDILNDESAGVLSIVTREGTHLRIPANQVAQIEIEYGGRYLAYARRMKRAALARDLDSFKEMSRGIGSFDITAEEILDFIEIEEAVLPQDYADLHFQKTRSILEEAIARSPTEWKYRQALLAVFEQKQLFEESLLLLGDFICSAPNDRFDSNRQHALNLAERLLDQRGRKETAGTEQKGSISPMEAALMAAALWGTPSEAPTKREQWTIRYRSLMTQLLNRCRHRQPDDGNLPPLLLPMGLSYLSTVNNVSSTFSPGKQTAIRDILGYDCGKAYRNALDSNPDDFPALASFATFLLSRKVVSNLDAGDLESALQTAIQDATLATSLDWATTGSFTLYCRGARLVPSVSAAKELVQIPQSDLIEKASLLMRNLEHFNKNRLLMCAVNRSISTGKIPSALLASEVDSVVEASLEECERGMTALENPAALIETLSAMEKSAPNYWKTSNKNQKRLNLIESLKLEDAAEKDAALIQKRYLSLPPISPGDTGQTSEGLSKNLIDHKSLMADISNLKQTYPRSARLARFRDMEQRCSQDIDIIQAQMNRLSESEKEAERARKEMQQAQAKREIGNVVLGFLDGQPDYDKIIKYWDPESGERPQTISRLQARDIQSITLEPNNCAVAQTHLRFANEHNVPFDRTFKIEAVKRAGNWYVRQISE